MLTPETLKKIVDEALNDPDILYKGDSLNLVIDIPLRLITRTLTLLKNHEDFKFQILIDICGVDYPHESPRFKVVYHLLSMEHNQRIRVKVSADDHTPIPSVSSVFSCANWYEREIWDLYGLSFSNHPDLRRLLTDYGFEGHPLRKDFPLSGYTQIRYDPEESKVISEPVCLSEDYRDFDFLSPWEGNPPANTPGS